jgi:hypothetical protein
MHIIKSRNPVWLLLDIAIMILCWKAGILVAALFFTFDTVVQLIYTILPDFVDVWEKNKKYRIFYTLFFLSAIFFVIRHLVDENII